jgi:hypothetical protein
LSFGLPLCGRPALAAAQSQQDQGTRFGPGELLGSGHSYLDLDAGVHDLIGNGHRNETFAANGEYHVGAKFYGIGPALGLIADGRGGGMGYAAIYSDVAAGPVIVTPLAGFGLWWHRSHGDEELGGPFEFRLSLAVAYQFAKQMRWGMRFGHISNANINHVNPGENDLMAICSWPLDF